MIAEYRHICQNRARVRAGVEMMEAGRLRSFLGLGNEPGGMKTKPLPAGKQAGVLN